MRINLHKPAIGFLLEDNWAFPTAVDRLKLYGEVRFSKNLHKDLKHISSDRVDISRVGCEIIDFDIKEGWAEIEPIGPFKEEVRLGCDPEEDAFHAVGLPRCFYTLEDKVIFITIDIVLLLKRD